MAQSVPLIVTISRQLGSGGSFIGPRLASRLGILYFDREIIKQAAKRLDVPENLVQSCDEKVKPFWQTLLQSFVYMGPGTATTTPPLDIVNDAELRQIESEIIERIAQARSAVIVGRGASHILRKYANHISIFLHASIPFRQQQMESILHLSAQDARKTIDASDQARQRYHRVLSGRDWTDVRQYDICLDTSRIGMQGAEDMLYQYLCTKGGSSDVPVVFT